MEKILGVSREEVRPEELRFFCAFWTELGYEVICPPPGSPKRPTVPLWCGTVEGDEEIRLRMRKNKISPGDILRLGRRTGESLPRLILAQRHSGNREKRLAQIRKYLYNKRINRGLWRWNIGS